MSIAWFLTFFLELLYMPFALFNSCVICCPKTSFLCIFPPLKIACEIDLKCAIKSTKIRKKMKRFKCRKMTQILGLSLLIVFASGRKPDEYVDQKLNCNRHLSDVIKVKYGFLIDFYTSSDLFYCPSVHSSNCILKYIAKSY